MKTVCNAEVHHTAHGTPYLKEPGVVLLATPRFEPMAMHTFLTDLGFDAADYENDFFEPYDPGKTDDGKSTLKLDDGASLAKFAGQLCYMSFGENRTRNQEAGKYFTNIKESGHGSVLEHANYSVLFYGIDRSCTHELVRHRAGFAYSQVSQRYVSGKLLRFVERPEYQKHSQLHAAFEERIDQAAAQYDWIANILPQVIKTEGMSKTDARKAVNQTARSCLPNEAEAPIVVTGNVRAWRNFLDQRASRHAEVQIRRLAYMTHAILEAAAPFFFNDYEHVSIAGSYPALQTKFRKV